MKERLMEFIKEKDISNRKFLLKCGLSGTYISTLTGNPSGDTLKKIEAAYPDLNTDWLLTGEGEMLKVPATVTVYNPTQNERQEVGEALNMSVLPAEVVEEIKEEIAKEIEKEIIVPIVPHEIATKTDTNIRTYIEENASELAHFDPRTITADVDLAETITTTSMSPIYMPNDKIFIKFLKEKTKITDGKIYYFDIRTRPTMVRMVKLLDDGRLLLRAANPRYGDIYLKKDEIINIGEIKSLFRDTFGDQYLEIDAVRRKKEDQIDKLVEQNGEALKIIHDLIKK